MDTINPIFWSVILITFFGRPYAEDCQVLEGNYIGENECPQVKLESIFLGASDASRVEVIYHDGKIVERIQATLVLNVDEASVGSEIILVSAADGPMPATREKVILAQQNGLTHLMVYMLDIDEVEDEELLELVEMEMRELLDSYGFDGDNTPFVCSGSECPDRFIQAEQVWSWKNPNEPDTSERSYYEIHIFWEADSRQGLQVLSIRDRCGIYDFYCDNCNCESKWSRSHERFMSGREQNHPTVLRLHRVDTTRRDRK